MYKFDPLSKRSFTNLVRLKKGDVQYSDSKEIANNIIYRSFECHYLFYLVLLTTDTNRIKNETAEIRATKKMVPLFGCERSGRDVVVIGICVTLMEISNGVDNVPFMIGMNLE